jgi:hypothetical protein
VPGSPSRTTAAPAHQAADRLALLRREPREQVELRGRDLQVLPRRRELRHQAVLGPLERVVAVWERALDAERLDDPHVEERAPDHGGPGEARQGELRTRFRDPLGDLQQDAGAGDVHLRDVAEIDDHRRRGLRELPVDVREQRFRGAEEHRAFELDHHDASALVDENTHRVRIAHAARSNRVAAPAAAHDRPAHAHDEEGDGDDQARHHRDDDVGDDRQHRDRDRHADVDARALPVEHVASRKLADRFHRPRVDGLDRDHDDGRRKHGARHERHQRHERSEREEHDRRVDGDRAPGAAAERAIGEARPEVEAAGDAAGARGHHVAEPEVHERPVAAGHAEQARTEQRVDRGDQRKAETAREDRRRELAYRGMAREVRDGARRGRDHAEEGGGGSQRGAQAAAQARGDEQVVGERPGGEAREERRHLGEEPFRVPHREARDQRHDEAEGMHFVEMGDGLHERHVMVEAQDMARLHEGEQQRRRVLEAGHHRVRRMPQQRAHARHAEEHLERARREDDGEDERQDQARFERADERPVGGEQPVHDDRAHEERGDDAGGVDRGPVLAHGDAQDGDDDGGREPGHHSLAEVRVTQPHEGEHPEADGEGNGDERRHGPSDQVPPESRR